MADGTRTRDHRDHNPGLYQLSYRHRARDRIAPGQSADSTAWVCIVRATRFPEASKTSVSTTIVVRPTWSGRARACTSPSRIAPRKFVFDSIVVVWAPGGRFRNAQTAVRYMVDHLAKTYGMSREQAYCLCGAAVDLKISEIVDAPNWIVSAYLPLSIFKK